jgi:hypothetical protein
LYETERDDRRLRQKRDRDRNPGAHHEHHEKDCPGAVRQRHDCGMEVDAIDRVVAEIGHGWKDRR